MVGDQRVGGIAEDELPALAEIASRQWTAQFNPRAVGRADFERILASAWAAAAHGSGAHGPSNLC